MPSSSFRVDAAGEITASGGGCVSGVGVAGEGEASAPAAAFGDVGCCKVVREKGRPAIDGRAGSGGVIVEGRGAICGGEAAAGGVVGEADELPLLPAVGMMRFAGISTSESMRTNAPSIPPLRSVRKQIERERDDQRRCADPNTAFGFG